MSVNHILFRCQHVIHMCLDCRTFTLALNVLLNTCVDQFQNTRYLLTSNKAVPLIDLCVLVLGRALASRQQQLNLSKEDVTACPSTTLSGLLLRLLASMVSTLAGDHESQLVLQMTDAIRYYNVIVINDRSLQ